MDTQEFTIGIRITDLNVDEEGKVVITNPDVARAVASAKESSDRDKLVGGGLQPQPANNCYGGNCAAGCGVSPKGK